MFSRPRARIIRCRVSIIVMCDRYSIGVLEDLVVIESIFMKQRTVWPAGIFFLNKLFQHWPCLRCEEFLEFSHPNRALMLLSSCLALFPNILPSAQIFILKKPSYYIREGTYWAEKTNGTIVHH